VRHLVVDVQVVMIASGLSDPPDDGCCKGLLEAIRELDAARLVWDDGGLIRSQYENKLSRQSFAWEWLQDLLVRSKVIAVPRARLTSRQSQRIRATGLVGEDLNYYTRTAASSPDRRLVSQDSDYDSATCRALERELDVIVLPSETATAFLGEPDAP
jgi:hypothetical protein